MQILNILKKITFLTLTACLIACSAASGNNDNKSVNSKGEVVDKKAIDAVEEALPFTDDVREHVVIAHKKRSVRSESDITITNPHLVKNKRNCFIIMSKKDFYLYVYEAQGKDTVMVARYDCCFALKKGNKERRGDMKTPHCTMRNPFKITQIQNSSSWTHDFGDGRGNIKSYGAWFMRLLTPGHSGIGIHGSTNNRESVPGRASEGCIRLLDEDIKDLRANYAFEGMKVIIKAESVDDYPFEIKAMKKQNIKRRRHFNPKHTLTNEQIAKAPVENFTPAERTLADEENTMDQYDDDWIGGNEVEYDSRESAIPTTPRTPSQKLKNRTLEEL